MVRSFAQWTKTLSFPARLSPQKHSTPSILPDKQTTPLSVTPDISDSEKDIMSSLVYCIHHKEGCKWNDQLRKLKTFRPCYDWASSDRSMSETSGNNLSLTQSVPNIDQGDVILLSLVPKEDVVDSQAHLNTCKHDAVPCSNSCGAQIPRVLMEDHLKFTCAERIARCDFCGNDLSGAALDKHTGACPLEPLYCENKCGLKLQRRSLARHKSSECSKRLVSCRYCTLSFVADTLQTHHAACLRAPVPCPNRCEAGAVPREDLDTHLRDQCASLLTPCLFKEAGCRFKGLRGIVMERHLEESSPQHLVLMCGVVTRQQHQISSLKSALARVSLNHTGTLVWKISDYSAKMAEARTKEGVELVSPPFYTSQFGYKLQASLFLNGNGAGENSHLSLYIKLLPGEYDALLRWPFAHSVAFTLFDQSEKACNIVESFVPDPTWENFQRPSKEPDSLGFGFPRFVSHETLAKRQFLRDDTLFLRIKVDPSKIVAV